MCSQGPSPKCRCHSCVCCSRRPRNLAGLVLWCQAGPKRLCTATVPLPLALPNGAMPHPRKAGDSGGGNAVWIRRDNAHKHFRWETGPALLPIQVDLEVSSWSRENPDVEKSEPSCIVSGCETVQHCGEQPANPFTNYM